jgi:hypothetical protein
MPTIKPISDLELMEALAEGEESARKCGWVSMDSVMEKLGVLSYSKSVSHRKRLSAIDE